MEPAFDFSKKVVCFDCGKPRVEALKKALALDAGRPVRLVRRP